MKSLTELIDCEGLFKKDIVEGKDYLTEFYSYNDQLDSEFVEGIDRIYDSALSYLKMPKEEFKLKGAIYCYVTKMYVNEMMDVADTLYNKIIDELPKGSPEPNIKLSVTCLDDKYATNIVKEWFKDFDKFRDWATVIQYTLHGDEQESKD